jgi:hypothetical protein
MSCPRETCAPCQQIICDLPNDVDIYSLEKLLPHTQIPVIVEPPNVSVGNDALEYCCVCE